MCHIHSMVPNCFPNRPQEEPAGRNLLPSEERNQTQEIVFCKRRGTVFETEYVSMKTNTACLPLKEILTGSKQGSAKWKEKTKKKKRGASLEGAFCSLFSRINETQTAVDTSLPSVLRNASALAPCGQEERVFFCFFCFFGRVLEAISPFSPLPSAASVRPATVLSIKAAPSTSRASSPKAPSPNNTATLKAEEREFSCYAAVLFVPSSLSDPCFVLN